MLDALALGARELASMPTPTLPTGMRTDFPSKTLPGAAHRRYLQAGDQTTAPLASLVEGISAQAIDHGRSSVAERVPQLTRERNLRIRPHRMVSEVTQGQQKQSQVSMDFTTIAAEIFIAPLINRFWLFLRDEQMRETRTSDREDLFKYHGAGTGLILNAMVLTQFLRTLSVLMHASQNAPEWLAVLAPDALELSVTLGTRPISAMENEGTADGDTQATGDKSGKEASLLTAAFELALIILDGCLEVDNGRSLGLEHTALLLGVGEWAGRVFALLESGTRLRGGGGEHEVKLRRVVAGVLLKVDEFTSRWRQSMVDFK